MKAKAIGLAIILLITGTAFYKPIKEKLQEKPIDKNISFNIYKGANYNTKIYDCTFVQVHVIVEKVSKHNRSIVWEKTFDEQLLRKYPTLENAIKEEITIPGVLAKKEQLQIKYVLTYNSKGTELQMQGGTVVEDSTTVTAMTPGSQLSLVL